MLVISTSDLVAAGVRMPRTQLISGTNIHSSLLVLARSGSRSVFVPRVDHEPEPEPHLKPESRCPQVAYLFVHFGTARFSQVLRLGFILLNRRTSLEVEDMAILLVPMANFFTSIGSKTAFGGKRPEPGPNRTLPQVYMLWGKGKVPPKCRHSTAAMAAIGGSAGGTLAAVGGGTFGDNSNGKPGFLRNPGPLEKSSIFLMGNPSKTLFVSWKKKAQNWASCIFQA
ncbi:hypothetical protein B0H16DRAFT_1457207 [Mycena metata]|uniref:Uncharacterized protein n=1 Tax=Mycena metata TaxID=1033252 RepID=A0AAD7NFD8_9AGAR|nr:hypothetical protein B0H16DRAFT_1457207 [Mycena metata]